jgi:acetyl-CoA synthetase
MRKKEHSVMLERFLKQTTFDSYEDFQKNFRINVPEDFNYAYDVMDVWAAEAPDRLAMIWTNDKGEERWFTFHDMKVLSDKAAGYFLSLGITKGNMVLLIMKRRWQFWVTMLALNKIGAIAIPASYLLTKKDIVYRVKCADIKTVICCGDKEILGHVNDAQDEFPALTHRISIGPNVPEGWDDWNAGVEQAKPFVPSIRYKKHVNDPMLMYFTSGTSGQPKMVLHDQSYALGHIGTAAYWHNLTQDSLHLTVSDSGWAKCGWGKLYGQWIVGATLFVYDHEKFTPADILHKIEQYKITSFCAPPTVYRFMIREDLSKFNLSSLRYATTAGEALNAVVFEKFYKQTGIYIKEGFGQSETTCIIATLPWMDTKPGAMGKPMPQYDVHLITSDGEEVTKPGEEGQIAISTKKGRPTGLFCGYYRDTELTNQCWHDGYYFTGDVAYFDEDGYYWYVGRADDVIKSSGYRIGPFEVESALMTHPAVVECAITGVPDEIRGQVIKATIILAKEWKDKAGEDLIKELQDHVKKTTAPYKYPRVIEFVDELPKTHSGKIRRKEIRERDEHRAESDK